MSQLIILISDHNTPDWRVCERIQPQSVFVLWTKRFQKQKDDFCNLLASKGIAQNSNMKNLTGLGDEKEILKEVLGQHLKPKSELTICCSGGTKVLLLETLRVLDELFEKNYFLEYIPEGSQGKTALRWHREHGEVSQPLLEALKLVDHIALYKSAYHPSGYYQQSDENYKSALQEIEQKWTAENFQACSRALLDNQMEKCLLSEEAFCKIKSLLNNFKNKNKFLKGGWLEFLSMLETRAHFFSNQKTLAETVLASELRTDQNEFDVLFTHQGKLQVIECKASFSGKKPASTFNEWVYKLDSGTASLGRVPKYIRMGQSCLAELANGNKQTLNQIILRAKSSGIKILTCAEDFENHRIGVLQWDDYKADDLGLTVSVALTQRFEEAIIIKLKMFYDEQWPWELGLSKRVAELDPKCELVKEAQTSADSYVYHIHEPCEMLVVAGIKLVPPRCLLAIKSEPPALVLNSYPFSLIRRHCEIQPIKLNTLQQYKGNLVSCWGHSNTLKSVQSHTSLNLQPAHERPSIELNPQSNLPSYGGVEYKVCFVVSPNFKNNKRPPVGTEMSEDDIESWTILKLTW